jgi:hypothetical protein
MHAERSGCRLWTDTRRFTASPDRPSRAPSATWSRIIYLRANSGAYESGTSAYLPRGSIKSRPHERHRHLNEFRITNPGGSGPPRALLAAHAQARVHLREEVVAFFLAETVDGRPLRTRPRKRRAARQTAHTPAVNGDPLSIEAIRARRAH